MNKLQKDAIYDEMCLVLTNFENGDDSNCDTVADDLYRFVVKIQNNWDELTSEE